MHCLILFPYQSSILSNEQTYSSYVCLHTASFMLYEKIGIININNINKTFISNFWIGQMNYFLPFNLVKGYLHGKINQFDALMFFLIVSIPVPLGIYVIVLTPLITILSLPSCCTYRSLLHMLEPLLICSLVLS